MIVQPSWYLKCWFKNVNWRIKTEEKIVYITFDDGPIPEVTPWVLDQGEKWKAKFTFFCVGENVRKHPTIFAQILDNGHGVGNHCYHHTPAFKVNRKEYFADIKKGQELIQSDLFRPPHGQLYPWYMKSLKKIFAKVVMWDVLTYDFDKKVSSELAFENVKKYTRPGSIIVFHDSLKAWDNLKVVLPKTLQWLHDNGYQMRKIE
ncbi:polysaccharide deacetylase family protein [bacterium]|nr:polysaccharide deacetylase family protein [bacterium]